MNLDFEQIFALEMPLEIFVRGTAIYWFLFLIFRLILRRDTGSLGVADVLLLVLLADAAQNAMAGDYHGVGDGFVLIGTLVFWNLLTDWLCYRFPKMERILSAPRLCLVRNGQIIGPNMRKQFVSHEDLMSQLREQGVDDLKQVKRAYLESDGHVSVIKREQ